MVSNFWLTATPHAGPPTTLVLRPYPVRQPAQRCERSVHNAAGTYGRGGTKACETTGAATANDYPEHSFNWDAALGEEDPLKVTPAMISAVTKSDNAAAEALWQGLGNPVSAALKIEAVLKGTGDSTAVQSHKVRAEFTVLGQTDWSLIDQARFASIAVCDNRNAPIFEHAFDLGKHCADRRLALFVRNDCMRELFRQLRNAFRRQR
jgi:hypothetical protein